MKISLFSSATLLSLLFSATAGATASRNADVVEVPLTNAFVPREGFDDNDTVQVVLDGMLPNSCYSLGEHKVSVDEKNKTVTVKQYAVRKKDGICAQNGANLPLDAQMVIPFQGEVVVGQLNKGEYAVAFKGGEGTNQKRVFDVASAPTTTVDNIRYAAVNNAYVPDVVKPGENIVTRLSGILNSSCTQLASDIRIQKVDDVVVVMPPVTVTFNGPCLQVIRPFVKDIDLGALTNQGRYLLHVRSMNGRSVNRLFSVEQ